MGLFDRFTGKELEDNIEEYTEIYGEILIGMHEKLKTHEKQLEIINRQLPSITKLPTLYQELTTTTSYELLETLKKDMHQLQQVLKSQQQTLSNHLTQSKQLHEHFQNGQAQLQVEIERMGQLITRNEKGIGLLQKQLTEELARYWEKVNKEIEHLQDQITDVNNVLSKEMNKNAAIANSLIKEQSDQQKQIDHRKKEILKNTSEIEKLQQRSKQLIWGTSIGIGLIVIWEIVQQLM